MKKDFVFRFNISNKIGTGHFYRCNNIAQELYRNGHNVHYFCNNDARPFLKTRDDLGNFDLVFLENDNNNDNVPHFENFSRPPFLIIDSYDIDYIIEELLHPYVNKILVIDDLANRKHHCDFLLDATFNRKTQDYHNLVPKNCTLMLGTHYALLSPFFSKTREDKIEKIKNRDFTELSFHIFFGGNDDRNHTYSYSKTILEKFINSNLTIVTGKFYSFHDSINELLKDFPNRVTHIHDTKDMAATLLNTNIAIGSPGITTWERACMGVAGIYLSTAQNQRPILEQLDSLSFCHYLGDANECCLKYFTDRLEKILSNKDELKNMSINSLEHVDGRGISRVIEAIGGKES